MLFEGEFVVCGLVGLVVDIDLCWWIVIVLVIVGVIDVDGLEILRIDVEV